MTRAHTWRSLALPLLFAVACVPQEAIDIGGHDAGQGLLPPDGSSGEPADGGIEPRDGAASAPADAGELERCGEVLCGPGLVCCSAACGTCVMPEVNCIATTCDLEPTCARAEDCGLHEFCDFAGDCGETATGTCRPRPVGCDTDCPGVCGCNGHTYCNACTAASAGVDLDPGGSC